MIFDAVPAGDGWEVIATDTGHPVTRSRESHQSAAATAQILNRAAAAGGSALARALGCVESGEPDSWAVRF